MGGNDAWTYGGGSTWGTAVTEDVIVDIEGVHIIGVSADPLGVPWQPETDGGVCCTIEALGVEVAGFVFQDPIYNAATGISCIWSGALTFGENAHIHNCFFYADLVAGIQLEYSWNNHIHDCEFQAPDYGIYCDPAEDGFAYCVIERCTFHDCTTSAISATAGCDDNQVRECWVWNSAAQAAGAATNEGFDFTGGATNMVSNCFFSCLLPVPAAGDLNDLCSGSATDAWVGCHAMDGLVVATPT